jgi:hypothetical protein
VPRTPAAGAITTADLADGAVIGGGGAADAQGPRRGRKGQE